MNVHRYAPAVVYNCYAVVHVYFGMAQIDVESLTARCGDRLQPIDREAGREDDGTAHELLHRLLFNTMMRFDIHWSQAFRKHSG